MLPEDQKQAWLHDRRGCIVGRKLAKRAAGRLATTFELESFIPPYRVGKPFDFVVDGIYDTDEAKYPGTDLNSMYFNYKYLYEATGQRARHRHADGVDRRPQDTRARISKAIDAEFENSDAQTKTETEQAFRASFVAMAGNLALLLNGIGLAVAFTILLVTANTMSIAVRERQQEIGVLKTLGFPSGLVMALILIEALLMGVHGRRARPAASPEARCMRMPCPARVRFDRRRGARSFSGLGLVAARSCFAMDWDAALAAGTAGWASCPAQLLALSRADHRSVEASARHGAPNFLQRSQPAPALEGHAAGHLRHRAGGGGVRDASCRWRAASTSP